MYNQSKTVWGLDLFCRNSRLIQISVECSMTTAIGYIINLRLKIYRKSHVERKPFFFFYKFDKNLQFSVSTINLFLVVMTFIKYS